MLTPADEPIATPHDICRATNPPRFGGRGTPVHARKSANCPRCRSPRILLGYYLATPEGLGRVLSEPARAPIDDDFHLHLTSTRRKSLGPRRTALPYAVCAPMPVRHLRSLCSGSALSWNSTHDLRFLVASPIAQTMTTRIPTSRAGPRWLPAKGEGTPRGSVNRIDSIVCTWLSSRVAIKVPASGEVQTVTESYRNSNLQMKSSQPPTPTQPTPTELKPSTRIPDSCVFPERL